MTNHATTAYGAIGESEYKRRIWAWTMYDWANSAFATTILAAVLPIYYSQVAGATLPSAAIATAYWSTGLSISLLIVAVLSPILGTISDVMRGKKRFLAIFFGMGIVATGLLVLVETGDWLLASILFILGRIGFTAANVFYDAMLPHVAREEDRDSVSTRGYAMGYLGGGLLLAINILMIQFLPGTLGPRLSFLSVAVWWAVFSIPIFLRVPEPPAATAKFTSGWLIVKVSFRRLWRTLKDIHQYRELFKYLLAFLIYIDGIGTIISVAAIYGAELGFGSIELVLALLLVQFVGIPYSLIFGRLPSQNEKRRPLYLAFVLYNIIALPLGGILGSRFLPGNVTGMPPESFKSTETILGPGVYAATHLNLVYSGDWDTITLPDGDRSYGDGAEYLTTTQPGSNMEIKFMGQEVRVVYSTGPDQGVWAVMLDGKPVINKETGLPEMIDGYGPKVRDSINTTFSADSHGEHDLVLENTGNRNPLSQATMMSVGAIEVIQPERQSNLGLILAFVVGVQLIGLILALVLGPRLFSDLAKTIDTKRGILLALVIYTVIAVWGFFLNSVIEFWFLAWMVAVVQGGSQALSRSLFSNMSPASKSGEFFGLFGIMEKFSAIVGPLVFAFAATRFGNSRPAVLSIIAFFILGGYLLTRVNVDEGRRIAKMEDAALFDIPTEG
jgi:UMF1 family MFS transporter